MAARGRQFYGAARMKRFLCLCWTCLLPGFLDITRGAGVPVVAVPGVSFAGSSLGADSSFAAADANGAVGEWHYVQFVNGHFAVYSKTNGARLVSKTHRDFWTEAGIPLAALEAVDPRTLYDAAVGRWYVSSVEVDPTNLSSNRLMLAVSAGPDPVGPWSSLALPGVPGRFVDFATLGFDATGVYVAGYVSGSDGGSRGTNLLVRVAKEDLLQTPPRADRTVVFPLVPSAASGNILQPAVNLDGTNGGTILAAASLGWDWRPHELLLGTRAQAGVADRWELSSTPIQVPPYLRPEPPVQPDGSDLLVVGDTRFSAAVYQVGGILYAVHSTTVSSRAAVRWYRIRAADFALLETGTITDPQMDLFYPSIAANAAGVVAIGLNGCGTNAFISSYACVGATREGVTRFGPLLLLKEGLDSYGLLAGDVVRWGDYSATSVDPTDPFRFWTVQLYAYSSDAWSTEITELRTALPELGISDENAAVTVSWFGSPGVLMPETSTRLEAPAWTRLDGIVSRPDGRQSVTVRAVDTQRFFRLRPVTGGSGIWR